MFIVVKKKQTFSWYTKSAKFLGCFLALKIFGLFGGFIALVIP